MPVFRSAKLDNMTTSIFTELTVEKRAAIARGVDVIDLSIGSPDLPPPSIVMDVLRQGVSDPSMYGYTITGIPAFNEAVAAFYLRRYGVQLTPETEVLQLMGSQDGLIHLAMAVLNPGDLVLCPDPGYTVYESSIHLAGGQVYAMPLLEENGFLPDLESIPPAVAERAKMIILNYPGNPVSALAPREFFESVVAFAKRYDILVVHDFAYSELVFDGIRAHSFLSVPGAMEVGVEFNSMSKAFNMAGCRVGYVVGNADVLATLALFKSHVDFGIFLPIQHAAVAALQSDDALHGLADTYAERRDVLCEGLAAAGWKVRKCPATMFLWARIPEGWSSYDFAFSLLREAGVAVTPGNAFGKHGEGFVRIALVQPPQVLREAVGRIERFLVQRQPMHT
ncbi:aminotransferase [Alicyclobacillus contaminans]|uniref:LL-diaminopimelate aminotransferase n=1 Tax=Alicyclobacillus contaminans TaxID=392016 RepID=UPI00041BACA0|nr:LL-diaminopimelate aminotransferase [Alicyclobacillus contaminans]GMA51481.1 aminotransferase [Alicyclobacillus contaminans]